MYIRVSQSGGYRPSGGFLKGKGRKLLLNSSKNPPIGRFSR